MCSPQFEFHGSQTQRQLKETLYDTIIDYFDKGKVRIDFLQLSSTNSVCINSDEALMSFDWNCKFNQTSKEVF